MKCMLYLSLLLSTPETTIVSTALVSIAKSVKRFDESRWVVTSYLLILHTGFLIIYAKFNDILGQKRMLLLALAVFTIFSIACGASQSMKELIFFQTFQVLSPSGIYSMVMVVVPDMVPYEKIGLFMDIISSSSGGFSKKNAQRLDWFGAFLSLAATIMLVFALQQGGTSYAWDSAPIISTFVLSGVLWIAFVYWERMLSHYQQEMDKKTQEPVLPWWLLRDRMFIGMLLNAFFTGFPFMAIINLPQCFQAVNETSASGFRLLPLLLCSPLASGLSGFAVTMLKIPPLHLIFAGGALQLVGIGLMSSIPESRRDILPAQYGYEVIMGFGFSLGLSTLLVMLPLVVEKKDTAVAMGEITQIRVLGGTIGLAICTALQNNHVKTKLASELSLTAWQIQCILDSTKAISLLGTDQQYQMKIMTGFSAAVFLTSLIMWERKPRRA
ncbi:MFS general substrate transporter [Wilcoxina mikolae CBS 423.85]|nr:MFS general substrate transporter [Wilcoxina mikolae CBS 423.85]